MTPHALPQVLIGWGGDTVVVSCRGTASFRNALSDIQVTRRCHTIPKLSFCDHEHVLAQLLLHPDGYRSDTLPYP